MSIWVQTLPTDLGRQKYPQPHKLHKRGNKLTHSKTYPRGVSSYLTTFLNDDGGARNPESDSDSDESFYSYSARLHVENDQDSYRSTLSDKVQPPRSNIYTMNPIRHASGQRKKHDPTKFSASERRHLKQAEFGRKHSRRESVTRRRPGIRKRSLPSSHDPAPTSSRKEGIHVEFATDDSSDNESFRKHQRPRTADASAQTDDWQELSMSLCRLCRCALSEETASSAPAQFAENTTEVKLPLDSVHTDQSTTPVDANLPSPEIGPDRQSETPSSKHREAIALEHGFAHSEELPDDVERLFDSTSFSIQGGSSGTSSMSSIAGPDGLRKELNALLDGTPISSTGTISDYGLLNPLPVKPILPPQISLTATNDSVSDLATSSALKSISGILFADPFISPPPASPQTNPSSTQGRNAPRSRTEAAYKRISSIRPPNRDIPPVPVIPAVFRADSKSLYDRPVSANRSHTNPSTPEESLVAAPESEVASHGTRQQLVAESDNSSTSEQLPPGILTAYLNRSTDSLDKSSVSCYLAQTCYGAPKSAHESSGIMSIIHPHSPIQVTSGFPATAQRTHSLRHVAALEETARIRQASRKSFSSAVDPQLKEYVERRLQAPKDLSTRQVATTSSSPRRRSSVWTKLLGMDRRRSTMAPADSAQEIPPVARRKLQRKQRSVNIRDETHVL